MEENEKRKAENITLRQLKANLRCLSDMEAPEGLKNRLLRAIPHCKAEPSVENKFKWLLQVRDFGTTAVAALLIFIFMLVLNYGLSVPSQTLATEVNDISLCYTAWDSKIFLYDEGNTCVEKFLPDELR